MKAPKEKKARPPKYEWRISADRDPRRHPQHGDRLVLTGRLTRGAIPHVAAPPLDPEGTIVPEGQGAPESVVGAGSAGPTRKRRA